MKLNGANIMISQVISARYSFARLIMGLQESIHLQDEISRVKSSNVNNEQYIMKPKDLPSGQSRCSDRRAYSRGRVFTGDRLRSRPRFPGS